MVVLGKVITVFLMVLIGYGAGKLKWLPVESSKYLSTIVINIAAPCVVVYSLGQQKLNQETLSALFLILGVACASYLFSWMIASLAVKIMKVELNEKGVYKNFLIFTNNAFMGFPVAYALFGSDGMFLMVLANIVMPIFMYTLGVHNLRKTEAKGGSRWATIKLRVKEVFIPPVIAVLVGLVIFLFGIPIPTVINDVLDMVGATMAPLCMIVIGIQLTKSKPGQVMLNRKLIVVAALRLIIIPVLIFTPLFLFKADGLVTCIMTLNVMMPCSAASVVLAEEYGRNAKLAAEGTFLSTLFSIVTIPIIGVFLTIYVL